MIIQVGKYKKIDPEKELYLGHEFEKNGSRSLDKRCDYCGKWITFDIKDTDKWGDNIKLGFNGVPEKVHCGSLHCNDYHRRVLIHEEKEAKRWENRGFELFAKLKKKGLL